MATTGQRAIAAVVAAAATPTTIQGGPVPMNVVVAKPVIVATSARPSPTPYMASVAPTPAIVLPAPNVSNYASSTKTISPASATPATTVPALFQSTMVPPPAKVVPVGTPSIVPIAIPTSFGPSSSRPTVSLSSSRPTIVTATVARVTARAVPATRATLAAAPMVDAVNEGDDGVDAAPLPQHHFPDVVHAVTFPSNPNHGPARVKVSRPLSPEPISPLSQTSQSSAPLSPFSSSSSTASSSSTDSLTRRFQQHHFSNHQRSRSPLRKRDKRADQLHERITADTAPSSSRAVTVDAVDALSMMDAPFALTTTKKQEVSATSAAGKWLNDWITAATTPSQRSVIQSQFDEPLVVRSALLNLRPWLVEVTDQCAPMTFNDDKWLTRMKRRIAIRVCPNWYDPINCHS
jgi:hypothetical protein